MSKCWSLKQVVLEQQHVIKTAFGEREAYKMQLDLTRRDYEATIAFADYETERMG